jgi:DnaJ-class molecular chaperone
MAFMLNRDRKGPRKPSVESGAIERKGDGDGCDQCGGIGTITVTPRPPTPAREEQCPKCKGSGKRKAAPSGG